MFDFEKVDFKKFSFSLLNEANELKSLFPEHRHATPHQVVKRLSSHNLIYFKAQGTNKKDIPLFFVPSLINHYYILDLLPGKSFIEHLTLQGYDVFLIEWGYPESSDEHITLDSVLKNRIPGFIDVALKMTGSKKVHLFGHCLGGTLTAMFAAMNDRKIQTLTLLTAPLDFAHTGKIGHWIQHSQVNFSEFQKGYGNVPWPLLHGTFLLMKPLAQYQRTKKYIQTRKQMTPEQKKMFWAMETWSNDSVSFRGNCFKTVVEELYLKNSLVNGTMELGTGKSVQLSDIKVPIFSVYTKDDHIAPEGSIVKDHHIFSSCPSFTLLETNGGHVGCLFNRKATEKVWPTLTHWLESHAHANG